MPRVSFRPINVEQLNKAIEVLETVGNEYLPTNATLELSWGDEGLLVKIASYFDTGEDEETCLLTLLNMPAESFDDFECTRPYACTVERTAQLCRILRAAPAGWLVSFIYQEGYDSDDDSYDGDDDGDEEKGVKVGLIVTYELEGEGYPHLVESPILRSFPVDNDYEFEEINFDKRVQIQSDVFRNSLWRLTGLGTVYISTDDQEVQFLEKPTNEVVMLHAENGECIIEVEDEGDSEMRLAGLSPAFQAALLKATAVSDRIELLGTRNGDVALECRIPNLGRFRFCEAET